MSRLLGLSRYGFTQWTDRNDVQPLERRPHLVIWDVRAVLERRLGGTESSDGKTLNLAAERARLARAQAEKTELELAARRGELVEVPQVLEVWTRLLAAFRGSVLALQASIDRAAETGGDVSDWAGGFREQLDRALRDLAAADPVPGAGGDAAGELDPGRAADVAPADAHGARDGRAAAHADAESMGG